MTFPLTAEASEAAVNTGAIDAAGWVVTIAGIAVVLVWMHYLYR